MKECQNNNNAVKEIGDNVRLKEQKYDLKLKVENEIEICEV